eukprot:1349561-Rhodomonas_salina.1
MTAAPAEHTVSPPPCWLEAGRLCTAAEAALPNLLYFLSHGTPCSLLVLLVLLCSPHCNRDPLSIKPLIIIIGRGLPSSNNKASSSSSAREGAYPSGKLLRGYAQTTRRGGGFARIKSYLGSARIGDVQLELVFGVLVWRCPMCSRRYN